MKSPIFCFPVQKDFPQLTSLAVKQIILPRSCVDLVRQHNVLIWHEKTGRNRLLSTFWPICEHLTTELWYNLLLLLPRLIWWLCWLDPFSCECHIYISGCQEQILCRPSELGFEGHTSGPYLLPCLLMEWAGTITKRIFILSYWLVYSLCFVYTTLCSIMPFYSMILDNCVNSSHLEIATFVLVCGTWGSAWVMESKPWVKMGHFRVISKCWIDEYVNHLQNL